MLASAIVGAMLVDELIHGYITPTDLINDAAADLSTNSEELAVAYQQEEESLTQELEGNGVLSGACSFIPQTLVATTHGEQPIGKLHVGDRVWAYNSTTRKMEWEPVLYVWIHQDNDLVDLTIAITTAVRHGLRTTTSTTREVIHTNQKHPFLTAEHGFLSVREITVGMHLERANGSVGVVTGWKVVPGVQTMYNLEVQQDHTFTVGNGQWVVHNQCYPSSQDLLDTYGKSVDDVLSNDKNLQHGAGDGGITAKQAGIPYQVKGANWLQKWRDFNKGIITADDAIVSPFTKDIRGGRSVYAIYSPSQGYMVWIDTSL